MTNSLDASTQLEFSVLFETDAKLGESPVYDEKAESFWWVDCAGQKLFRTHWKTGRTAIWQTPERPGFVCLTDAGTVAVGMQTGIFEFLVQTGRFERKIRLGLEGFRFNDAVVDPSGTLWAGVQRLDATVGAGMLFQVTGSGKLALLEEGFTFPNGMAVDPDRNRYYYSDSHASSQTVWTTRWPHEPEKIFDKEVFFDFAEVDGRPDGASIDQAGNYWIAAVDTGNIFVFSPKGAVLKRFPTPFSSVTKLAFGGPEFQHVFVTSKGGEDQIGGVAIGRLVGAPPGQPSTKWRKPSPLPPI